jgi:hypothetical protein
MGSQLAIALQRPYHQRCRKSSVTNPSLCVKPSDKTAENDHALLPAVICHTDSSAAPSTYSTALSICTRLPFLDSLHKWETAILLQTIV